MILKFW